MFNKKFNSKQKRERNTPQERLHLGVLEHKKEFKQRRAAKKELEQKQRELQRYIDYKNPDEFYTSMTRLTFDGNQLYAVDQAHQYDQIPEIKLLAAQKRLRRDLENLIVETKLGKDVEQRIAYVRDNINKVEAEFERRRGLYQVSKPKGARVVMRRK